VAKRKININKLEFVTPIEHSGYELKIKEFSVIKKQYFKILDNYSVDGDAPKQIIRLYKYQIGKRTIDRKWDIYITKTGHKNYPNESITEQLFTDIGKCLGLNIADSFLGVFSNQLKFCSKYFLKKNQSLIPAIEIYANYFGGAKKDKDLFNEIEKKGYSKELVTVKFTYEALKKNYKENYVEIFNEYIKLLLFDALVGNNDRHFYNWGIKKTKNEKITLSPIYDTARGLFWNITEEKIKTRLKNDNALEGYIKKTSAKTSYDGNKKENHFKLIENIFKNKKELEIEEGIFRQLINIEKLNKILKMIDDEYYFLSLQRKELIKKCLIKRFEILSEIIK